MKNEHISRLREFTRFYTNIIGLLNSHLLDSAYTLPEARVLYEIAQRKTTSSKMLMEGLTIDKGYLSRILKSFQKKGVIEKRTDKTDGRASIVVLTKKGRKEFNALNKASERQAGKLLTPIPLLQKRKLVDHMDSIQAILRNYQSL